MKAVVTLKYHGEYILPKTLSVQASYFRHKLWWQYNSISAKASLLDGGYSCGLHSVSNKADNSHYLPATRLKYGPIYAWDICEALYQTYESVCVLVLACVFAFLLRYINVYRIIIKLIQSPPIRKWLLSQCLMSFMLCIFVWQCFYCTYSIFSMGRSIEKLNTWEGMFVNCFIS